MISVSLEVGNQKGTPMIYSDVTASRPTFGITGRLFVATDSPYGIFRDTGSAWVQIAAGGSGGNTIYTGDGTLTGNRTITSGGFNLTINAATNIQSTQTAVTTGLQTLYTSLITNYSSAFSSSVGGYTFTALDIFNSQVFNGNATFDSANINAGLISINRITQNTASSTITMSQTGTARSMSALAVQNQYNSGIGTTISHLSGIQIYGNYKASVGTLSVTTYYALLINDNNEYSGVSITNSYGIYQAGVGDRNILRGQTIVGGVSQNSGKPLVINGDLEFVTTLATTSGGSAGQHLNIWVNGTQYKIALNLV